MINWTESMQHTYEYYVVNPRTWKDDYKLDNVTSCTIDRDDEAPTRGSAAIDVTGSVGECYIRAYLIAIQNGMSYKIPLGTFLVQTPSSSFDGKIRSVSMDAYTPLLELKENPPPIGYFVSKGANIMDMAYMLTRENTRAPVIKPKCDEILYNHFVADTSDTWLTFNADLALKANHKLDVDELGRILFSPKQDTASLQPVWTFTDDNSSILYPEFSMDHDLFGIPNAVEVIYSDGKDSFYAKIVNDDSNSPTSTVNRGREILDRVVNPTDIGNPTDGRILRYAEQRLRELSTVEYTISFTHAYCPVRVGDCVRLNYHRAGIVNVKAQIISQSISCKPGCPVSTKAKFTTKLWR